MDKNDLVERLEKAEAGSRELDAAIWCAATGETPARPFGPQDAEGPWVAFSDGRWNAWEPLPPVTTSLDAALALAERVLPGARWVIVQQDGGWGVMPLLFDGTAWDCPNEPGETVHASLAVALCIAILRASNPMNEGGLAEQSLIPGP